MTQSGAAPITFDEVQGAANPYANALKSQLSSAAEKARAAVTSNQGTRGSRSFGDISTGRQLEGIQEQVIQNNADIDFDTLNQAYDRVLQQRQNTLSAGGQMGNLATQGQTVTSGAINAGLGGINQALAGQKIGYDINTGASTNQVAAGTNIRNYNQGVNDIILQNISGEQGYPLDAMNNAFGLLSNFQSQMPTTVDTGGGGSDLGGALSAIGGIAGAFSDRSLKENIVLVDHVDGVNVYDFNYKATPDVKYRGAIAQEVANSHPDAVMIHENGFLMVDYSKLPIGLRGS